MTPYRLLPLAALALLAAPAPSQVAAPARTQAPAAPDARPPLVPVTVVARYPHDRTAFTEGLLWHDGALYESVGREGQSDVRRVRLATGAVEKRGTIPPSEFGEGLALHGGELVSLTWRTGSAYRWDPKTLRQKAKGRIEGEGWGLTSDGRRLIQSDGSATLHILDPRTLARRGGIAVTLNGRPIDQLNELEWVDGAILANVWHQPFVLRIDPATGRVTQVIDLRPLVAEVAARDPEAVANGIAWDAKGRRLFVTGKLWPTVYEVKLAAR